MAPLGIVLIPGSEEPEEETKDPAKTAANGIFIGDKEKRRFQSERGSNGRESTGSVAVVLAGNALHCCTARQSESRPRLRESFFPDLGENGVAWRLLVQLKWK